MNAAIGSAPTFALLLRVLREDCRWTQCDLADAAGVDRSLVSRIESGTRHPKMATVHQFADALGVDDGTRYLLVCVAAGMSRHQVRDALRAWQGLAP